MDEGPKSNKPPGKKRKGPKLPSLRKMRINANYIVTCRNCGFNHSNQSASCPKCGTKKGELI